jgi:hypothetical protein
MIRVPDPRGFTDSVDREAHRVSLPLARLAETEAFPPIESLRYE